ncbi:unnamed protein product [Schistosoma intercalatum]|nr:unnamed protein product [Schistosoma intercalatum]CAH8567090.1 unnamed protein product [Schistosoma intercalatum]
MEFCLRLGNNNYPRVLKQERLVIPYRSDTLEEVKRILNKHDIRVYFRASGTIRSALVKVMDRFPKEEQQNVLYEINCHDCNAVYVRETSRQLNVNLKKHEQCLKNVPKSSVDLKKLENRSAIALHELETGHKINFEGTKILQEGFGTYKEKLTAEALYIWANKNSLNRKDGIQLTITWKRSINK